jgi:hypothetical protein
VDGGASIHSEYSDEASLFFGVGASTATLRAALISRARKSSFFMFSGFYRGRLIQAHT